MARFMRKGRTRVHWVPTITTLTAPTVAQITAGTRLDTSISDIEGFTFANSPIDVPDMSTAFVGKISGEDTVENSAITLYEDDAANPIMTTLAKGTNGYVVFFPTGYAGASHAVGDKTETWTAQIGSNARVYTTGNEAAKYRVGITTLAAPVAGTLA